MGSYPFLAAKEKKGGTDWNRTGQGSAHLALDPSKFFEPKSKHDTDTLGMWRWDADTNALYIDRPR